MMVKADVGNSYIMARKAVDAEPRRVPLSAETLLLLNNIGDQEHIWLKPGGEPMDSRGLQRLYRSIVTDKNRKSLPPSDFCSILPPLFQSFYYHCSRATAIPFLGRYTYLWSRIPFTE